MRAPDNSPRHAGSFARHVRHVGGAADTSDRLYASMHLNFLSKLERRLMEDLARQVIEGGAVQSISKVGASSFTCCTFESENTPDIASLSIWPDLRPIPRFRRPRAAPLYAEL
jgi:hypothetical protein